MNSTPFEKKNKLSFTLFSYLLSAVTGALGLINWAVLRNMEMTIVTNSGISRWSWQAIDNFSFILLGMIWLSFVLFTQYFFAKSAHNRILWCRFASIAGPQLLLLLFCQTLPVLMGITGYNNGLAVIHGLEAVLGIGLLYAGRRFNVRGQQAEE